MSKFVAIFLFGIIFILSCNEQTEELKTKEIAFKHTVENDKRPWNSESFEVGEEDFTFGIIADLTGGERPGIFSVAVEQMNRLEPSFVLSVGDLIEGGTKDLNQLEKEWDSFSTRANKLTMPFFYLGGNHDLSNAVMQDFWKQRFGVLYYHFVYEDVLFLMLDSEDFDTETMQQIDQNRAAAMKIIYGEIEGDFDTTRYYHMPERRTGALSEDQIAYFSDILDQYPDVRWTFLLMHKPVWTRDDDKGLRLLEAKLADRNYTVINGHEHSFSYQQKNNQDYMILGTTGGFQSPDDLAAFDHITVVRMAEKPVITHLRMDGILNEQGQIPLGGDTLNFQASQKK